MRTVLANFLCRHFEVDARSTAVDALAYLFRGNIPDLVLLDISLPGISGLEFLSEIRTNQFFRHIPVVIISGQDPDNWQEQVRAVGIQGYLQKPFDPQHLLNQMQHII